MPGMESGHEVETPSTDDPTPLPIRVDGFGQGSAAHPLAPQPPTTPPTEPSHPTAHTILLAIAASEPPWFPSRYATDAGIPRDSLDEPLAELRLAGLIRVAEWVRGVGQGYALTPEGQAAATNPTALEQLKQTPPADHQTEAQSSTAKTETTATDPENAAIEVTDTELSLRPPLVVPILLMANALWYFVCAVIGIRWGLTPSRSLIEGHPDVLHRFGAVSGTDLLEGEWWRLITSCFVHIGALHLIGNLFALAMMGPLAELLWGRTRLLLIYFISGLAGSALAMALRPDVTLAGASGAIWGIQMSLFAWLFAFRRHLPPDVANDWFRRLCVVFVLNAGISFLPKVSWEGHLGGGVAGFLVAGLLTSARFGDQRRRMIAWLSVALLPVLSVAGLAIAMDAKGMPGWQRLRQRLAAEHEAREMVERLKKFYLANTEFNAHVLPLLPPLAPQAVEQPEAEARELAKMTNRPPEQLKAARAKLESLKATADSIIQLTTRDPTGIELFDRTREQTRAFAAARMHSFDLLLAMLAGSEPPKLAAWDVWHAAHLEANRLWPEQKPKK